MVLPLTSNPTSSSPRVKPDDVCPIHGGHKWHFCIFNKDGPNYRPPARNTATIISAQSTKDNFNNEQVRKTNDYDSTPPILMMTTSNPSLPQMNQFLK